jgi:hypothetical protein
VPAHKGELELGLGSGNGFTVPVTATLMVVTPNEATVIFPEGVPVADAASLTYIVVLGTEPPDWVKVTDEAKPLPLVVDISKPVGALIVIFSERLFPETTKFCSVETVPLQLVKAASGVPEMLIVGVKVDK